jgi:hypothetical protein
MQRIFTVELTASEALAVHRMAALSGMTSAQLVQKLHRFTVFDCIVALSTGVWEWFDPRSHTYVRNLRMQRRRFEEYTRDMLGGMARIEHERTIQGRTGILPRQV